MNASELNVGMCGWLNRDSRLCSKWKAIVLWSTLTTLNVSEVD